MIHNDSVNCLALLPDGSLASCSGNIINFWNTSSGKLIRALLGHKSFIYSLLVLNDEQLASGAYYGELLIWNITSGVYLLFFVCFFTNIKFMLRNNYRKLLNH